jgi:hypothetical protein
MASWRWAFALSLPTLLKFVDPLVAWPNTAPLEDSAMAVV